MHLDLLGEVVEVEVIPFGPYERPIVEYWHELKMVRRQSARAANRELLYYSLINLNGQL